MKAPVAYPFKPYRPEGTASGAAPRGAAPRGVEVEGTTIENETIVDETTEGTTIEETEVEATEDMGEAEAIRQRRNRRLHRVLALHFYRLHGMTAAGCVSVAISARRFQPQTPKNS